MKNLIAKIESQTQNYYELRKKFVNDFSELITKEIFNEIFDKNPKLESFGWKQYTTYFNDGDECTFSANTDYIDINGIDMYDLEDEELDNLGKDISELLSNISDEIMKDMFGDHKTVTIYKNKIEIECYDDHD